MSVTAMLVSHPNAVAYLYSVYPGIVRRARERGLEDDDIGQICWMSVMRAEKTFDPSRGSAFPTYALNAMRNGVVNHLRLTDRRSWFEPIDGWENLPERTPEATPLPLDVSYWLGKLLPRQRQVIEMRFGLNGHPEMILAEIGAVMGFTGARAGQIEKEALDVLRRCEFAILRVREIRP